MRSPRSPGWRQSEAAAWREGKGARRRMPWHHVAARHRARRGEPHDAGGRQRHCARQGGTAGLRARWLPGECGRGPGAPVVACAASRSRSGGGRAGASAVRCLLSARRRCAPSHAPRAGGVRRLETERAATIPAAPRRERIRDAYASLATGRLAFAASIIRNETSQRYAIESANRVIASRGGVATGARADGTGLFARRQQQRQSTPGQPPLAGPPLPTRPPPGSGHGARARIGLHGVIRSRSHDGRIRRFRPYLTLAASRSVTDHLTGKASSACQRHTSSPLSSSQDDARSSCAGPAFRRRRRASPTAWYRRGRVRARDSDKWPGRRSLCS